MSNTEIWSKITLGEFSPFEYGKSLLQQQRKSGNIPVYGSNGIIDYNDKAFVDTRGIIIGRKGSIGEVHISNGPFWPIDTTFYIKDEPLKRNLYFTYSLLKNLKLQRLGSDSAVPGLNRNYVHSLTVSIPPLEEQKKIAGVLGSLDDKIELLRDENKTLEAMAQAIFKSWFVDFDIVKAKAKGTPKDEILSTYKITEDIYNLFPDSFTDSPLGQIPTGWEVKKLTDFVNIVYGKGLPTTKLEKKGYPVFGGNGIIGYYSKYLYKEPQVLISCRGAASGAIHMSKYESFITNNSLVCEIKDTSQMNRFYLFLFLLKSGMTNYATGSAQPQITIENLSSVPFLKPNNLLLEQFNMIIEGLDIKREENNKQIQTLTETRDTLLPQLISGKIRL